MLTPQIFWIL